MKDPNGYICQCCSKQWGNWSCDSNRELVICSICKPQYDMYNRMSKDELIRKLINV